MHREREKRASEKRDERVAGGKWGVSVCGHKKNGEYNEWGRDGAQSEGRRDERRV